MSFVTLGHDTSSSQSKFSILNRTTNQNISFREVSHSFESSMSLTLFDEHVPFFIVIGDSIVALNP